MDTLPVEIRVQDERGMTEKVESMYGDDFVFDQVKEYQVQSPELQV